MEFALCASLHFLELLSRLRRYGVWPFMTLGVASNALQGSSFHRDFTKSAESAAGKSSGGCKNYLLRRRRQLQFGHLKRLRRRRRRSEPGAEREREPQENRQ